MTNEARQQEHFQPIAAGPEQSGDSGRFEGKAEGADGRDHRVSTGPLYVLEDENGDLFLSCAEVCGGSTSTVVLYDCALWDAYVAACTVTNRARRAVQDALRRPWRPTTPETLTMRQIADVKQWAAENGRKGLHADAVRCESAHDAPTGALRRLCKHINDATKPPANGVSK